MIFPIEIHSIEIHPILINRTVGLDAARALFYMNKPAFSKTLAPLKAFSTAMNNIIKGRLTPIPGWIQEARKIWNNDVGTLATDVVKFINLWATSHSLQSIVEGAIVVPVVVNKRTVQHSDFAFDKLCYSVC